MPAGDESHTEHQHPPLVADILGILPKLIDRTSAQLQFSQTLLSMLPCTRSQASGRELDDADIPSHEAPQPTDVLTLLEDDDETTEADEPDPLTPGAAAKAPDDAGAETNGNSPLAGQPVPAMDDLAIPEYDSLAASQVVPRLTTLAAEELEAIGSYEAANRARRTILNRVTALLAG
ncbi:MAG: hypothetical protein ACR2OH_06160 [Microthrixaceae bacterium]